MLKVAKFTIKIHMALGKFIIITVLLLNMKYLRNIWMFDNDFLAECMLISNNLLNVYMKMSDFLWLRMVQLVYFSKEHSFFFKMS